MGGRPNLPEVERLTELRERLEGKRLLLVGEAQKKRGSRDDWLRLGGKADGVALAMSFVDEAIRTAQSDDIAP